MERKGRHGKGSIGEGGKRLKVETGKEIERRKRKRGETKKSKESYS